jgi:hypothetical protein
MNMLRRTTTLTCLYTDGETEHNNDILCIRSYDFGMIHEYLV